MKTCILLFGISTLFLKEFEYCYLLLNIDLLCSLHHSDLHFFFLDFLFCYRSLEGICQFGLCFLKWGKEKNEQLHGLAFIIMKVHLQ